MPCTLRKKNSDSSCHGSNNCYVWALEIQQIAAKRNGESSTAGAIVNKCLSSSKHDKDDIESLLLNEGEISTSNQASDQHDDETDTMIKDGQCDRKH